MNSRQDAWKVGPGPHLLTPLPKDPGFTGEFRDVAGGPWTEAAPAFLAWFLLGWKSECECSRLPLGAICARLAAVCMLSSESMPSKDLRDAPEGPVEAVPRVRLEVASPAQFLGPEDNGD